MDGAGSVLRDGGPVRGRPVSAMVVEPILREAPVIAIHHPVPGYLRDHRRGRDRGGHDVTFLDREVGDRHAAEVEAVPEHEVGPGLEALHRGAKERQVGDVQSAVVDPPRQRLDHRDADRPIADPVEPLIPLARGEQLGVREALDVEGLGQDHGGRHERAGERAPACLVGARDQAEALRAQAAFVELDELGPALQSAILRFADQLRARGADGSVRGARS